MSNDGTWQDDTTIGIRPNVDYSRPDAPVASPAQEPSFTELSARLNDNLASATLELVDAAQDFTGLIRAYVAAGQGLERSIASVRELASASLQAVEDSRRAAAEAAVSAKESQAAQQKSVELIQLSTQEHIALAELTDSLRQRIVALAVLGTPIVRHEVPAALGGTPETTTEDSEAA